MVHVNLPEATLLLTNIAVDNPPFLDDFPEETIGQLQVNCRRLPWGNWWEKIP